MQNDLPIKSLWTAFRILEMLVDQDGATMTEVANELEKPNSTVHDYLSTLTKLEYIIETDGVYRITANFLRMGDLNRQNNKLYSAATNELNHLATETGEHVSLVVEEHGEAVIIATEEGEQAIPVRIYDGIRMKMHTAAPGKAILAFLPESRVDEVVERHRLVRRTVNTITDRESLDQELEETADRKYALDDEERLTGMRSIAVPIIDRNQRVRGALTIYGPTNRIEDELFRDRFPELLLRSGNIVEVLLNYD